MLRLCRQLSVCSESVLHRLFFQELADAVLRLNGLHQLSLAGVSVANLGGCLTDSLCLSGWLPLTHSVRHGSKAVTRHRRPVHILKQKLLAVTKYVPPPRDAPPGAYPSQVERVQEVTSLHSLSR